MTLKRNDINFNYLKWLIKFIPDHSRYFQLLFILHHTEYTWLEWVPRDENRAADAISLRKSYISEVISPGNSEQQILCIQKNIMKRIPSVLEVLVALCLRMEDMMGRDTYNAGEWFWLICENLRIRYSDDDFIDPAVETDVYNKLEIFLNREYDADGNGSAFPGSFYKIKGVNAYDIDLWYQCNWYLSDIF